MDKIQAFCEKYGVDRKNTDCVKWDGLGEKFGNSDLLPVWIADMEFKVPEEVQKAMIERIEHGVFGYTCVPDSYYEAYFNWQKKRYNVALEKDWIRFSTGIVNAFFWMVNCFTEENDNVILLSPVYYPFYNSINDTGRNVVTSNVINNDGKYTIDFEDFEKKIVDNKVKLFIHCSPHNPIGRVWTKEEMTKLYDICLKHDVMIVADEIHQDLIRKDITQVASLSLDKKYWDHLIVLSAPSKSFNMACLLHSHIVIPDEKVRAKYDAYAGKVNNAAISVMGMIGTEACYRYGDEWLDGLIDVIDHNHGILATTFGEKAPKVVVSEKEGTYLSWLDLSAYVAKDDMEDFIQNKVGVAVDYGHWFGEGYDSFIRINVATQPEIIQEVADRIVAEIAKL